MSTKMKAAPKPILQGVDDQSGGILPVIPEQLPTHLPHVFLYTERGPLEPQLTVGAQMASLFGAKSFDLRSAYANHQTVLANTINGNGNAMIVQRMKPADAADEATLVLYLDIIADQVPEYQRSPDGSYTLDTNGDPIPLGTTVAGYRAIWTVEAAPSADLSAITSTTGILTDGAAGTSTKYPMMAFKVSDFGAYGNNVGLRLWAPTTKTSPAINEDVVTDQNSMLYRLQFIERPDATSSPNVINTLGGSKSVEFSLMDGAINKAVDQGLFIDDVVLDAYRNLDIMPKIYGPFNELYVYHANVVTVSDMIYSVEQPNWVADWPATAAEGRYLVNLVSAKTPQGIPYYNFVVEGALSNGVELTSTSNHYAAGGADGTMDFASFDALVANEVANYGDLTYTFMDSAYWPQSIIWDSGYSLETKKKLLVPMGRRKDMMCILSTQDASQPQNDATQETSMAIALRAAARLYPESEVYGTGVCRAIVIGHSGYLINSQWSDLLPLTIDLANKVSKFMGASNGIWKADKGFDNAPYNQVTLFKGVNCTYKDQSVYDADWDTGLNWVQYFDRRSLFFPAIQTVYDDPTSVLNAGINAFIITEIEKVAERVWRQLVGGSKLTPAQFIEKSNKLIEDGTRGRFDDRVTVVAKTFFDDIDTALGYSWSTEIELYMGKMRTVGSYTIVAKDRAQFA